MGYSVYFIGIATFVTSLLLLSSFFILPKRVPKALRLPPGPRGAFLSGNASVMTAKHPWLTFTQWAKQYGSIVYIHAFGQPIVIINSADIALELLEKRSIIYSDRFEFPMLNDVMGFNWNLGLMHYGERWRRYRKAFHQEFNSVVVSNYHEIQERAARAMIRKLFDSAEDFSELVEDLATDIIMETTYGFRVGRGDPHYETLHKGLEAITGVGVPGTYLVDAIPLLKLLPEWINAEFQLRGREARLLNHKLVHGPYNVAKAQIDAGVSEPSMVKSMLEKLESKNDPAVDAETVIREVTAVTYFAGAETTVAAIRTFFFAMALYPDCQKKAQEELDTVVGRDRFPGLENKADLPFVHAVCKEVLRWRPVVPLGIAHRVTQDDVFRGYFIPKGSIVIANAWAILHDERVYGPNPDEFVPERFLDPSVEYPSDAFGYGRRMCPGRHFADNSLFIVVASVLSVFNITPATDDQGNDIPIEQKFTSALTSAPEPFRCSFKLRSSVAKERILSIDLD